MDAFLVSSPVTRNLIGLPAYVASPGIRMTAFALIIFLHRSA